MTNKLFSEDDSDNQDKLDHSDKSGENQSDQSRKNPTSPFHESDEDVLDEARKAFKDLEPDEMLPDEAEILEDAQPTQEDVDNFSSRITSLQSEDSESGLDNFSNTPPFVMDDLIDFDENNDTLAEKLRKGWIQPETLRLIINDTMSDAEISQVANELGVDWHTTPGNNNAEKLDFLIDYFQKMSNNQDEYGTTNLRKTQPLGPAAKQNWQDSDNRLQALQDSLTIPGSPETKSRNSYFSQLVDDLNQTSPLVKSLIVTLSILALLLIVAISYFYFIGQKASPPPAPATPMNPYPQSVQLPGGWNFDLQIGTVQNGSWSPVGAEWLEGTEVCRLVSLPRNNQLDAVFKTLKGGEQVSLIMSNKDLLPYKVESTRTINPAELDQLITRDTPCLIIILTQTGTDVRQAIIAVPAFNANSSAGIVTITPASKITTPSP